ncbi:Universal stress protein [Tenacibaculum sp. 190130A14a]|uniref:Universal stress protein n=1 Tax=Tenacibaculum polynesiense TaxID=3137857 RepID=A0ABM9PCK1_9FLAO
MKHILIPTDFSENAWAATKYILNLFTNETCTFHLLHSAPVTSSRISSFSNKLSRVMQENALKDLKHLQERIEKTHPNPKHSFKSSTSTHDIEQAVSIAVENHQIDLVVMGTKGATGAKEIFLGSNTVEIISKLSKCPVLAIPNDLKYTTPKNIGFSSGLKRLYNSSELNEIKDLANLHKSNIHVLHIQTAPNLNESQKENLEALKGHLKDMDHAYVEIPQYTNKTDEIINFIKNEEVDILTMIKYKHGFFEKLFREPVIANLGHQLTIPFMVIPATA